MSDVQLLLLRHGEVASHRGDVPVTEAGLVLAERTGKAIGAGTDAAISVLFGGTRRTRETAEAIVRGIGDPERVDGPTDAFALRNPDMYVAGTRVNMVSSPAFLAEQVAGMTLDQVETNRWWTTFFNAPDRIGWWLTQDDPPGENSRDIARRIQRFARSFADPGPHQGRLLVCVTHSPLLRAVLSAADGQDPGEPPFVTGVLLQVSSTGEIDTSSYDPLRH
ncbi:MAG: histidine phosphatase family protein [Nocardioides sp.]